MQKTIIKPSASPAPVGPYNHAVRFGHLLFTSGQIGLDPATGQMVEGLEAQTVRVLENLKTILEAEKLDFSNVIKTTVFLMDLNDFSKMNEIYGKYFTNNFPARSTVQVAGLPKGARVEIEAIAHY